MGSCCEPKALENRQEIHAQELKPRKTDEPVPKQDPKAGLNATSLAGLRQKYDRLLKDKDIVIHKNEQEAEAKQKTLRQLEQAGNRLECEKLKRQIDTHLKLVKQAQDAKQKIQEKIDEL